VLVIGYLLKTASSNARWLSEIMEVSPVSIPWNYSQSQAKVARASGRGSRACMIGPPCNAAALHHRGCLAPRVAWAGAEESKMVRNCLSKSKKARPSTQYSIVKVGSFRLANRVSSHLPPRETLLGDESISLQCCFAQAQPKSTQGRIRGRGTSKSLAVVGRH
jgi:hypothetical protein